jgi:hypothetical protein
MVSRAGDAENFLGMYPLAQPDGGKQVANGEKNRVGIDRLVVRDERSRQ